MGNSFLSRELELLKKLSTYSFEIGVLQEDSYKTVKVNILNTDGSVSQIDMSIDEVMYLTEYGTMTIPAQHILDKIINYSNSKLDDSIGLIMNKIFENENYTISDIETDLNTICIDIENYSKVVINSIIKSNNTLGNLLKQDDENKYLYDLNKLKNFIKCKLIKNNFI